MVSGCSQKWCKELTIRIHQENSWSACTNWKMRMYRLALWCTYCWKRWNAMVTQASTWCSTIFKIWYKLLAFKLYKKWLIGWFKKSVSNHYSSKASTVAPLFFLMFKASATATSQLLPGTACPYLTKILLNSSGANLAASFCCYILKSQPLFLWIFTCSNWSFHFEVMIFLNHLVAG